MLTGDTGEPSGERRTAYSPLFFPAKWVTQMLTS